MDQGNLQYIQNLISYRFRSVDSLRAVFTDGYDGDSVSFVGSTVLQEYVVRDHLSKTSSATAATLHNALADAKSIASSRDPLGLAGYFTVRPKWNLFLVLIGTAALDCNFDRKLLDPMLAKILRTPAPRSGRASSFIERLYDWSRANCGDLPTFSDYRANSVFISYTGANIYSDRCLIAGTQFSGEFSVCKVILPGYDYRFYGCGSTKEDAKSDAFECACLYLGEKGMMEKPAGTPADDATPDQTDPITALEVLSQQGTIAAPVYEFFETPGEDGNPIWTCTCYVVGISPSTGGESSSKKAAKKIAALEMLRTILKARQA